MRVVSLHPDVLLATSAIWQTNCVIVRGTAQEGAGNPVEVHIAGEPGPAAEAFVIDSPILPEELDALPALIGQAGFPAPSGLLATHADWDHLLARLAFPEAALGCAASTARRLSAEPGAAQRELRAFDRQFYVERPRPLMLGSIQALDVPGQCEIGLRELQLHPADGHTEDGMAIWLDWAKVLVVGDYLSTVESPQVDGSTAAYIATLGRLRPLVELADYVVPGHGPVLDGGQALELLEENSALVAGM
ncbi:MAG TPA: MBL fold metallo-hydrolase [Solirubrobacteraceae bacterium]|nr:MBL fold metallo-hydrolase [Solirubrobacteraceae bacterium]